MEIGAFRFARSGLGTIVRRASAVGIGRNLIREWNLVESVTFELARLFQEIDEVAFWQSEPLG
jgi:hypothetical protein